MNNMANKTGVVELTPTDMEKVNSGSWLGIIWNKIKSFDGSFKIDITDDQENS